MILARIIEKDILLIFCIIKPTCELFRRYVKALSFKPTFKNKLSFSLKIPETLPTSPTVRVWATGTVSTSWWSPCPLWVTVTSSASRLWERVSRWNKVSVCLIKWGAIFSDSTSNEPQAPVLLFYQYLILRFSFWRWAWQCLPPPSLRLLSFLETEQNMEGLSKMSGCKLIFV